MLFNAVSSIQERGEKLKSKFNYAWDKNLRKITDDIESLKKINTQPLAQEYQGKVNTLIREYGKKDEEGNLILVGDQPDIPDEKLEEFKEKIKVIDDEYIPKLNEANKLWKEATQEEVNIDFYKLSIDDFPEYTTNAEYEGLKVILKDE